MSFIFNDEIKFSDSPNLDAFSRLRVSEPFALFTSAHDITSGDTQFETIKIGSGNITYNSDKSEMQFSVTSSGDTVIRQQHGYNFYQPSKSQMFILTGIMGTPTVGVNKKIGYFDDRDGLFFQYSGLTLGVVLRTSTSGSIVNTFIPQSDWNIDTLNTGSTLNPSKIHYDPTKTNIYLGYFQWLGVGRVIYGLDIDGVLVPIHEILNGNNKTEVYMRTGSLPVRYELESVGGSDNTFKQLCSSVISEGGQEDYGYTFKISNGLTTKTIASRQSVLSIRLSNLFYGKTNRSVCFPVKIELITTTASVNAEWELIYQKSHLNENNLGGSPTWTALPNSPLEYSVNGTTVVGGTAIDSGYVYTTTQQGDKTSSNVVLNKTTLNLNYSGNTSDWLHLVVTPNNSSAWAGSIIMKALY